MEPDDVKAIVIAICYHAAKSAAVPGRQEADLLAEAKGTAAAILLELDRD